MSKGAADDLKDPRVFRRGIGVLWVALRTEWRMSLVAVLGATMFGAFGVLTSNVIGYLTDHVILPAFRAGEVTPAALWLVVALSMGVGVLKAIGLGARRFFAGIVQYRMQARYRRAVARKYLDLPLSWHHRHPTGQLLSNANADVEATWQPLAPLPMAIGSLFMLVFAAVAMLVADPVVALVGFVVFPALAVVNVVFQRRVSPVATRAQALRAHVSEVAHESFDGALVVKSLGREDTETERFTVAAHRLRDAQIQVGRLRGLFDPIMDTLPNLGVLAVLLIGSWRLSTGSIEAGDLVQIAYLFTLLAMPIRSFGWLLGDLARTVVGWDRVQAVLRSKGTMDYGTARLDGSGGVRLGAHGASFSYEKGERVDSSAAGRAARDADRDLAGTERSAPRARSVVLHDIDFEPAPGRTVALVGSTGAGKSTLTTVLMRLVDPDTGTVTFDGTDLRDLAHDEIARAAALVPQTTFVFEDTVRGNITLGGDIPDEQVWAALRLARADSFIAALPEGIDTRLGERGTTLSGGQRQRLALAQDRKSVV